MTNSENDSPQQAGPYAGDGPAVTDPSPLAEGAAEPPLAEPPLANTAPPPKAKQAANGGVGNTLLTLVLAAALGGGIYYTWTNPLPVPESPAIEALRGRVATLAEQQGQAVSAAGALTQQLAAISARLDKLEHAGPATTPDLTDLTRRVETLASQVDALGNRPARSDAQAPDQGASTQAITDLSQKLDAVDTAQKAALAQLTDQAKQATQTLAARLDKLEAGAGAVNSNADRAARLTAIEAAVVALEAGQKLGDIPGAPPALTRYASVAPPTEAGLRESFPAIAAQARAVSRPDVSQKSFWARALTRLQQSVTVRQGDDVLVGDPAAGILAEAEEKVHVGDLPGAVASLRRLQGPAADAVKDWADQAQGLADARAALAGLAAHS